MRSQYVNELNLASELIREAGKIAKELFSGDGFKVYAKGDNSTVTSIDLAVSDYVIQAAGTRGINVRSEEEGSTACYGEDGVFDLDPIDGTRDLIEGYARQPRWSTASPSLGFWNKEPVIGVVTFPLLGMQPVTYLAAKASGAYREQGGRKERLEIDTAPTRGIVFVNSKMRISATQTMGGALSEMGYTPISAHGAVFKASCVADKGLLKQYPLNKIYDSSIPVVGFVSKGIYLHDIAAATCIVREAGGIATSPRNQPGRQPWAVANNQAVYNDLMSVLGAI